jgi:hypothetical protein
MRSHFLSRIVGRGLEEKRRVYQEPPVIQTYFDNLLVVKQGKQK